MKRLLLLLYTSTIGFSFIIAILKTSSFHWMAFWDTMFALSLLLSMIGACIFLFNSGVFQPFVHNIKYFLKKINRVERMVDEVEQKDGESSIQPSQSSLGTPCLITGLSLVVISSVFSIIL